MHISEVCLKGDQLHAELPLYITRGDHRAMAECGRKALSLLEAARSRYESLQISDDVFGESGDDSSDNPFYSTSADSNSDNYTADTNADHVRAGDTGSSQNCGPPGSLSSTQAEEEGWSDVLQDIRLPSYKDTHGRLCHCGKIVLLSVSCITSA